MSVPTPVRPGKAPVVVPALPLALLEAVRSHDRPGEVLEDEDLALSMPRRLGLTGVVSTQIRRYETAYASKRKVPLSEVGDLMTLILRRPDAATILDETGRRVTRLHLEKRVSPVRKMSRLLPRALVFAGVRRAAVHLIGAISGGAAVRVIGKPLAIRVENAPTAQMDSSACHLYTGALEELIVLYTGTPRPVRHGRCAARGDATCEWTMEA